MFLGYNFQTMKKYILAFLLVFLASVLITSQYEKYAHDSTPPSQNSSCPAVTPSNPNQPSCNSQQPQDYPPRWLLVAYQVFGWPNGITVWALFFTLLALADQTAQTKKAANAAKDGANAALKQADHMVASERAWILLSWENTAMLDWFGPPLDHVGRKAINCIVALKNSGRVPGNIFCNFLELRFCEGNTFPDGVTMYEHPLKQRAEIPMSCPPESASRLKPKWSPDGPFLVLKLLKYPTGPNMSGFVA